MVLNLKPLTEFLTIITPHNKNLNDKWRRDLKEIILKKLLDIFPLE